MKLKTIAVLATTLLATNVMAEEKLNPWKHCGIGAAIFDDNGTAAAISNIIWDFGTTAVTSQASSEDSCAGAPVKAAMFIQDNFDKVLEETSQGSGEHLNAMLSILDVEAGLQASSIEQIRAEVGTQVASNSATPESYYNAVMSII
ncbi:DUF3015 family protein [Vibrio alfacsensis]|uniref:DUF3015 family protein n=1 Tax=Vibrio alfacsensis TaxID=1074311 RepID=UPI004067A21C